MLSGAEIPDVGVGVGDKGILSVETASIKAYNLSYFSRAEGKRVRSHKPREIL